MEWNGRDLNLLLFIPLMWDGIPAENYHFAPTEPNARPQGYKQFPCSTQLSMKFFLPINVTMPTFMSRENSIIGLS